MDTQIEIKIRYFSDKIERLCYIGGKSDWVDLRAAKEIRMAERGRRMALLSGRYRPACKKCMA